MRMRGLEPPPGFPDTDLNRARLPIPPHPRGDAKISHTRAKGRWMAGRCSREGRWGKLRRCSGGGAAGKLRGCFASLGAVVFAPLSSRGLGRRPLMAETRVRIPVAVSLWPAIVGPFLCSSNPCLGAGAPPVSPGSVPPTVVGAETRLANVGPWFHAVLRPE
jgi:hypothetical protein